ncbi:MAG: phosphate ABC transporter substrate-binding protein [Ketobacteraceae bacterium]|nr:phosphate ABC transporter substrate-binding protein [Ketobacteraceae bacterium]
MKKIKTGFIRTSVLILSMLSSGLAAAEIAVVVNPVNRISALNASQVRDIFLGINKRFPDGELAAPIEQGSKTTEYSSFSHKVLGYHTSQLKAYWASKIFTGKGAPPPQVENNEAVKNFLHNNPNGIGYISKDAIDPRVKVILLLNGHS